MQIVCVSKVYINAINMVVNLILPTAALCVLNCLIYKSIRENQAREISFSRKHSFMQLINANFWLHT
jgi:hypothetical protein